MNKPTPIVIDPELMTDTCPPELKNVPPATTEEVSGFEKSINSLKSHIQKMFKGNKTATRSSTSGLSPTEQVLAAKKNAKRKRIRAIQKASRRRNRVKRHKSRI